GLDMARTSRQNAIALMPLRDLITGCSFDFDASRGGVSCQHSSCIDRPAFGVASRLDAPERILQIDARTNVLRDHGDRVNVEAHGLGSRVRSSSCNLPRNSVTRATRTIPVNRGLKKSIASPPFARSQGVPDSLPGQSRATRLGSAVQFRTFGARAKNVADNTMSMGRPARIQLLAGRPVPDMNSGVGHTGLGGRSEELAIGREGQRVPPVTRQLLEFLASSVADALASSPDVLTAVARAFDGRA